MVRCESTATVETELVRCGRGSVLLLDSGDGAAETGQGSGEGGAETEAWGAGAESSAWLQYGNVYSY
eukprot:3030749-Rhodomonas_salina.1